MPMTQALDDVIAERYKQRGHWTDFHDDEHNAHDWAAILLRYEGLAMQAAEHDDREGYRLNLVKAAAVALAAIESYDRVALQQAALHDDFASDMPEAPVAEGFPGGH